jgi:hypothetical protein
LSINAVRTRPSRPSPRRRRVLTGALVVVAAFGGVACGDDDEDAAPSEPKSDFAAYCDAEYKVETYFAGDPEVDFETATPEQIQAAVATYLQGAKPLIDAAVPLAPAEIKEPLDVQVRAFNQALGGADPEVVFETPEVNAAEAKVHGFDLKNCGWGQVDVTATDYSFAGIPDEVKAGRTSIDLTNDGKEAHEVQLAVKNAGVTQTFDEILALPEEEALTMVTPVGGAFASPGDKEYAIVDLAPGSYVAVCFVPQGTVDQTSTPAEDAPPHFVLGMKKEFTVA